LVKSEEWSPEGFGNGQALDERIRSKDCTETNKMPNVWLNQLSTNH